MQHGKRFYFFSQSKYRILNPWAAFMDAAL